MIAESTRTVRSLARRVVMGFLSAGGTCSSPAFGRRAAQHTGAGTRTESGLFSTVASGPVRQDGRRARAIGPSACACWRCRRCRVVSAALSLTLFVFVVGDVALVSCGSASRCWCWRWRDALDRRSCTGATPARCCGVDDRVAVPARDAAATARRGRARWSPTRRAAATSSGCSSTARSGCVLAHPRRRRGHPRPAVLVDPARHRRPPARPARARRCCGRPRRAGSRCASSS